MIHAGPEWGALLPYVREYAVFGGMVLGALILGATPLGRPLGWAETFYHELSHGIMCLVTLGKIDHIALYLKGGGVCAYRGGFRPLVAFSGYAGAALWGAVLYIIGANVNSSLAVLWLEVEIGVLAVAYLFFVRKLDVQTTLILALLGLIYAAALVYPRAFLLPWILQFMGIYVMLNAIRAPLFLLDGKHVGDGATLADIFVVVPEVVWVLIWFVFALAALGWCAMQTLPGLAGVVHSVTVLRPF